MDIGIYTQESFSRNKNYCNKTIIHCLSLLHRLEGFSLSSPPGKENTKDKEIEHSLIQARCYMRKAENEFYTHLPHLPTIENEK